MSKLLQNYALIVLVTMCCLWEVYGQGLTDSEKMEILKAHNYFRGQVDPIATNMLQLEWDEELAYLSQFRAASCEFEKEDNDDSGQQQYFGYDSVGENAAATYASGYNSAVNYTRLVQRWFIEKRFFSYYRAACFDEDGNINDNGESETCGRYVQLVWGRTYAVGCGAYKCQEMEGADDYNDNALFLVCSYGPGSNLAAEPPYSTGSRSCDSCPDDRKYCNKNLCSKSGTFIIGPISIMGLLVVAYSALHSSLF